MVHLRLLITIICIAVADLLTANSGRFYPTSQLSSGLITCICQDQYGYIWIGTEYGLNKFDGYHFVHYFHQPTDSMSLTDNEIVSLHVGKDGRLWVGSAKGLVHYDYQSSKFTRWRFPDDREPRVNSLTEDAQGRLLIGTAGYGLYGINKGQQHIDYLGDFNRQLSDAYYARMFIDRQQAVWRSSHLNEITRFSVRDGKPTGADTYESSYGQPMSFIDYSTDALLIVCAHGILRFDYRSHQMTDAGFDLSQLGESPIEQAYRDADGNLFIGTSGNGLMLIRQGEKRLQRVENSNRNIDLRLTDVRDVTEDRSGNLWVGCYNKGLLMMTKQKEAFENWSFMQQNYRTGGSTTSITAADDGGVWCVVKPGGLYKLDQNGRIMSHPSSPPATNLIYRDGTGQYWLGSSNALYRFYPGQETWTKVREFGGRGITTMTDDGNGTLYIGVFGQGLYIYDTASDRGEMLSMRQTSRPEGYLCNDWIKSMTFDSRGMLWIATAGGISMMIPKGRVFNAMGWNTLFEGKQCYALCEMDNGAMLFSTDTGLYLYDSKTNKTEPLQGTDPLQDMLLGSLVCDKEGNIWMSSTMGIWRLSKDCQQVTTYISGNGLVEREYIEGAVLHTPDGRIYFGTPDGITTFLPSEVGEEEGALGTVLLTGITVNGRALNPMQDRFELSYRENTLSMEFSLLDFRNAENISYEWRVNGSKNWQQTGEGDNRITFSELQPGTYLLEVRAINNGVVSKTPSLIRIIIHQPWYKSTLAYLFYILVAGGFIGLILYNFERQRRRDMEEMKMRFLINATHDIRSPLTLIMGPLEKLKKRLTDSESQSDIETIDKNAQRLLVLVNQILDERKIDKGQMKLSCQETDLVPFIGSIFKLYEFNASQRNISYTFEHSEEAVRVWIDRVNFDKVISNLLSNAFKYSFDHGQVCIRLWQEEKRAVIQVVDSGIGFEDDKTERFFERFYQGRNSKDLHIDGTGIGLNLSRAITEMHGGTITAANRKDGQKGAILTVTLPLGKDHLKPDEIEPEHTKTPVIPTGAAAGKQQANRNFHILIVDDDAEIGRYISRELGKWYYFDYAENGREALKKLLAKNYDLTISDVIMPEMDGITLLRSIKQNPNISHIPVILLTSKSEVSFRLEGLKKGADAYLSKPFSMEELHILIDNLVDNVRRLRGKFTGAAGQQDKVEMVEVKGNDDILMEKIMKVINAHLSDPDLSMDVMTKEVGISRAQLHRKMKEMTGISTSEFIRNLRLEQAARLIREKKINITQVAYSVGFNNQTHFSTVFKKHFGMTPTEYAEGDG